MQEIKVSVIIPVYNVEEYLEECLHSVLNQTLKDIEIICINDGSTDNSLEILNKTGNIDDRVIILDKINEGVSKARNMGLSIAKGSYIYFMDSDDYIDLNTLELCYNAAVENECDIVTFDAKSFSEDKNLNVIKYDKSTLEEKKYIGFEFLEELFKKKNFTASCPLNFFKKDLLLKNNMKFSEGYVHEDQYFVTASYCYSSSIYYIKRALYNRRMRNGSIMTTKKTIKNIEGYFKAYEDISNIKITDKKMVELLNYKRIELLIIIVIMSNEIKNNRYVKGASKVFFKDILYTNGNIKKKIAYLYYLLLPNSLINKIKESVK